MKNGNDQNQKPQQQKRDNRDNRQRGGGDRNHGRPRPKTVEMELFFIEQRYGDGSTTPVHILQDGIRIYPRSPRFNPQVSTDADFERGEQKLYTCLVRFTEGKDVADCMPKVWQTLSPDEFLPEEEWRKAIVVPLIFSVDKRDERGRPKAFHKGKVVFVDRDSEVTLNQSRLYMLSYGGRVAYAHALPHAAGSGGHSNALTVQLGEKLGELSLEGLKFVVLSVAQNKSGIAMPKSEKDLVVKKSYKSVYELLGVSPDASEDEIKRAYRQKSRIVHPDAVLPKLGKHATIKDETNVTFFWEAVQKAYESALTVLDRAKGKKAPVQAPVSEKVETEASAPVESAPLVETPAAVTESAPADDVVAQVETELSSVETPVIENPAVEAPKALTQEEELAAAAVLANTSLEEFKAKAPSFQKHYLQQVRRGNTFNRPAPAKSNGGKKSPKPQKVAKSLADIGKVLEKGDE